MSLRRRGALLVACAAVCWSSGGLIARLVGTSPWTTNLWRSLFASLFLGIVLSIVRRAAAGRDVVDVQEQQFDHRLERPVRLVGPAGGFENRVRAEAEDTRVEQVQLFGQVRLNERGQRLVGQSLHLGSAVDAHPRAAVAVIHCVCPHEPMSCKNLSIRNCRLPGLNVPIVQIGD